MRDRTRAFGRPGRHGMKAVDVFIAIAAIALMAVLAVGMLVWGYPDDEEYDLHEIGTDGHPQRVETRRPDAAREPRPL